MNDWSFEVKEKTLRPRAAEHHKKDKLLADW